MARNKSQQEINALAIRSQECTALVKSEKKLARVKRRRKGRKLSGKEREKQSMMMIALAAGIYSLFKGGFGGSSDAKK